MFQLATLNSFTVKRHIMVHSIRSAILQFVKKLIIQFNVPIFVVHCSDVVLPVIIKKSKSEHQYFVVNIATGMFKG